MSLLVTLMVLVVKENSVGMFQSVTHDANMLASFWFKTGSKLSPRNTPNTSHPRYIAALRHVSVVATYSSWMKDSEINHSRAGQRVLT